MITSEHCPWWSGLRRHQWMIWAAITGIAVIMWTIYLGSLP